MQCVDEELNASDDVILHSSIMGKSSSRFSFILKSGNDELDETISLLFSNIAQAQYKGDLAKLIRDKITYLVQIGGCNYGIVGKWLVCCHWQVS